MRLPLCFTPPLCSIPPSETPANWQLILDLLENAIRMTNRPLSRRAVLRGAGAMLALPFLESWAVKALAADGVPAAVAATPPLRLGIVTVTGGTVLESWRMPTAGPLDALPSILRPLEFCKDELLLLTGLSHGGKTEGLNGHESCAFTHLTGAPLAKKEGGKPVAGVSVDQAAARFAGRDTLLPSLELGLAAGENLYSFRSAQTPVPYEADPRLVYDRMFRGRVPIVPNWQRRAAAHSAGAVRSSARRDSYDQSVIDLVLDEAKGLQHQLGQHDRQKFDEYLFSVRSIETRLEAFEARLAEEALDAADPGPSRLVAPQLYPAGDPFYTFEHLIQRDPEKHGEYIRLMSDLLVLAFQTDTTRVATLAIGSDGAWFPGVVTVGYETHCHTLEHQGNAARVADADPIAREACRQIHAWYTGLFAETVRKLQSIDEGGSSLLDNTLLLYTSYMADGGHGRRDYPALLVGKAGGTLKPGRQIDFQDKTPMSNLFVEMVDRMGGSGDGFGESGTSQHQAYDGRLPGLV